MLEDLTPLMSVVGVCVILPITIVWLILRHFRHETENRTKIVLAAMERAPEMDIEELLNKISPNKKLLKEKLLSKMTGGIIVTLLGFAILGYNIWAMLTENGGQLEGIFLAVVLLSIGIALLASFFIGKKMLAKEIEEEEKNFGKK